MAEEKIKELLDLLQKQLNESRRINHKLRIVIALLALLLLLIIICCMVVVMIFG